jgi:hypothetical protein
VRLAASVHQTLWPWVDSRHFLCSIFGREHGSNIHFVVVVVVFVGALFIGISDYNFKLVLY